MANAAALWAQYMKMPDPQTLAVYADALQQEGDPRGTYLQLKGIAKPTEEQKAAIIRMEETNRGAIVGPAKAFVRETEFGPSGLVDRARTELPNLLKGLALISELSPRLILTLTSVKTLKDAVALGKVPPAELAKIWFVDFGMLTGSLGGIQLTDKQMAAIGPAFAEVEHLQLSCRGAPGKAFSPEGLRAFGTHLKKLRYLSFDFYRVEGQPPVTAYARVIGETPGFATLRALDMEGITDHDLGTLKLKLNQLTGVLNFAQKDRYSLVPRLEKLVSEPEFSRRTIRSFAMRGYVVAAMFRCGLAHGDPASLVEMSGPFLDLPAACEHLEAALDPPSTPSSPARCKQLDAGLLVAERADQGRVQRLYAIALHRRDGWWTSPDLGHAYKDGDAASHFGSNCCHAAESAPRFATWHDHVAGFRGAATVLRVVMHGWSVVRKGWPDEGQPGNSATQVSLTICGTTASGAAGCYAARAGCACAVGDGEPARCLRPQIPRFSVESDHLVLACP